MGRDRRLLLRDLPVIGVAAGPPAAEALLLSQVPIGAYHFSEAAFFTAAVLNTLSFVFEDSRDKRQLALLSALIKGLSWHSDHLVACGQAIIIFDASGSLLLPSRHVQWIFTTPTMLFTLSKISDFSCQQVALVMLSDLLMIVSGYTAAIFPFDLVSCLAFAISFSSFYFVLYSLYLMIRSALAEASSPHARASLRFTLWSSLVVWHIYPVAWCISRMDPSLSFISEPLALVSNFSAKLVFSSCILYNNFLTLQQRRVAAQSAQHDLDRIRMVGELRTALQSKDDFITVIGHELRMPLNAIIQLSAAVLADFRAPGTWEKHYMWLQTISRSAKHLLGIINDIMTVKAARSGMHIKQELVHAGHLVDHVIQTLRPLAKRAVVVEKTVAKRLPLIVADKRRIIQLLSNLLGNALKFTDKGKASVSVRVDQGARHVVIRVQDTGCGIPAKELKSLLVPFKQVDMSAGRKHGGTGLGLRIASQLVQAHAGTIELHSDEGVGTRVVVKLPVLQPRTHALLEGPFKAAYVSCGFSYEELMSSEVAKMESRRVAVFQYASSTQALPGTPSTASTRSSLDSSAPNLQVEQFCWDCYYDQEANRGPAATGPPAAASAPTPLPVLAPVNLDKLGLDDGAAARRSSSSFTWGQASLDLHQQGSRRTISLPGFPDAAARGSHSSHSFRSSGSGVVQEGGGVPVPPADAAAGPSSSCLLPLDELRTQPDDEPDDYAGLWHRAPRFGDDYDDSQSEYYSYDNRVRYVYRPSLDQDSAGWNKRGRSGRGEAAKGAAKPLIAAFRRISMSLRRRDSVDAPRQGSGRGRADAAQGPGWRSSAGLNRGGRGDAGSHR